VRGSIIKVEVLTTTQALLTFASGAQITFLASWDVWRHGVPPIEIHGTEGSMRVPDPNFFGGPVSVARERGDWAATETTAKTFGVPNWPAQNPGVANYRGLGLAEMARAILEGRPHRASGDLALHVLAVMAGILDSAVSGKPVAITDGCERPAPLGEAEAKGLLAG
jgi:predicted dehydrogenase